MLICCSLRERVVLLGVVGVLDGGSGWVGEWAFDRLEGGGFARPHTLFQLAPPVSEDIEVTAVLVFLWRVPRVSFGITVNLTCFVIISVSYSVRIAHEEGGLCQNVLRGVLELRVGSPIRLHLDHAVRKAQEEVFVLPRRLFLTWLLTPTLSHLFFKALFAHFSLFHLDF